MAAAGVGVAVGGMAGCAEDEEPSAGATPAWQTPQAQLTPKPGGTTRIGNASDVPAFDPATSPAVSYVGGRLYQPLHTYNFQTNEIIPLIAESIEEPDEVTYNWKLRQGVKFQNVDPVFGREVISEDAKYTFERLAKSPSIGDKTLVSLHTVTMEAPDRYTFTLKTNAPYSLTITKSALMHYCIVPKEGVEKFGDLSQNAVGSGPFMLVEHKRDERGVFRRNPDYFRTGRPYVDGEEWIIIHDAATQWEALKTDRLDTCSLMAEKPRREELQGLDHIELVESRNTAGPLFYMRVDRPPLNDERVREALDIAIDRDDYLGKVHFGEGKWNGPVPWTLDYWALPQDELRKLLKRDVQKAKQLLSAAGYPDGFELKPPIRTDYDAATPMLVVADHFADVGVKCSLQMMELGRWLAALYSGDYDVTFSGTYPYVEPEIFLRYYHSLGTSGAGNHTHVNDPEIDAWVEGLWRIFDLEEQRDYVLETQRKILGKHSCMLCTCMGDAYYARNRRVKGSVTSLVGPLYWMGTEYWIDEG